jgi:hypothetical protein
VLSPSISSQEKSLQTIPKNAPLFVRFADWPEQKPKGRLCEPDEMLLRGVEVEDESERMKHMLEVAVKLELDVLERLRCIPTHAKVGLPRYEDRTLRRLEKPAR